MPDETNRQDTEKDTPTDLPTEDKPADVEEQTEDSEGSLPDDAKERTKTEFEKLTKANRELKAELEARQGVQKQSVLDSLRPQGVPQAPPQEQQDDFVDAEGYVDTARLKEKLQRAEAEAQRATTTAQQAAQRVARYTETEEMRRVHKDFPTLDPEGKDFDPVYFDLVRDKVISQMTQGKQDVYLAAQQLSAIYKSDPQKAKEKQDAEFQATTTAKEQINASGSSAPNRSASHEDLVRGTMQGDRQSMYERMQKAGG